MIDRPLLRLPSEAGKPNHRLTVTMPCSGTHNVREKLAIAEAAGAEFARNADRLREVQLPDVLPVDIDANLGAPWVREADIQLFASQLFRVPLSDIRIGHLKKDAVWSVDADLSAAHSVAATNEFGTSRSNGTRLLELALNMKAPVIYDTIRTDSGEERVVNQAASHGC